MLVLSQTTYYTNIFEIQNVCQHFSLLQSAAMICCWKYLKQLKDFMTTMPHLPSLDNIYSSKKKITKLLYI